jgi:thioredoxin reductase
MKWMQNNSYDVIIIGSGLGGLSAGAILSKRGKKAINELNNKEGKSFTTTDELFKDLDD